MLWGPVWPFHSWSFSSFRSSLLNPFPLPFPLHSHLLTACLSYLQPPDSCVCVSLCLSALTVRLCDVNVGTYVRIDMEAVSVSVLVRGHLSAMCFDVVCITYSISLQKGSRMNKILRNHWGLTHCVWTQLIWLFTVSLGGWAMNGWVNNYTVCAWSKPDLNFIKTMDPLMKITVRIACVQCAI